MSTHAKSQQLYEYCTYYLYASDIPVQEFCVTFTNLYTEINQWSKRERTAFDKIHEVVKGTPNRRSLYDAIQICNRLLARYQRKHMDESILAQINALAELIIEAYLSEKGE